MNNVKVEKITGKSKKTGKEYTCFELTIGDYRTRFFPTPIEIQYITHKLEEK